VIVFDVGHLYLGNTLIELGMLEIKADGSLKERNYLRKNIHQKTISRRPEDEEKRPVNE